MRSSLSRLLGRFQDDDRGVAAVEFAFVFPLMIVAYFGLVDVTLGFTFKQRLNHAAAAVNDLVGQSVKVKQADVQGIFEVASVMLSSDPSSDRLKIRTTSVKIDEFGRAAVAWSVGKNMAPEATGKPYTLPKDVKGVPGDAFLMTELAFRYSPVVSVYIAENVTLENTAFGRARGRRGVSCTDCSTK